MDAAIAAHDRAGCAGPAAPAPHVPRSCPAPAAAHPVRERRRGEARCAQGAAGGRGAETHMVRAWQEAEQEGGHVAARLHGYAQAPLPRGHTLTWEEDYDELAYFQHWCQLTFRSTYVQLVGGTRLAEASGVSGGGGSEVSTEATEECV